MLHIRFLAVAAAFHLVLAALPFLVALVVLGLAMERSPAVVVDQLALAPVARFVSGG